MIQWHEQIRPIVLDDPEDIADAAYLCQNTELSLQASQDVALQEDTHQGENRNGHESNHSIDYFRKDFTISYATFPD